MTRTPARTKAKELARHESRQSLEIYSRLSLAEAQPIYEQMIQHFPIHTNVPTTPKGILPLKRKEPMMSAAPPNDRRTLSLHVRGMDCTEYSQHVQQALASL